MRYKKNTGDENERLLHTFSGKRYGSDRETRLDHVTTFDSDDEPFSFAPDENGSDSDGSFSFDTPVNRARKIETNYTAVSVLAAEESDSDSDLLFSFKTPGNEDDDEPFTFRPHNSKSDSATAKKDFLTHHNVKIIIGLTAIASLLLTAYLIQFLLSLNSDRDELINKIIDSIETAELNSTSCDEPTLIQYATACIDEQFIPLNDKFSFSNKILSTACGGNTSIAVTTSDSTPKNASHNAMEIMSIPCILMFSAISTLSQALATPPLYRGCSEQIPRYGFHALSLTMITLSIMTPWVARKYFTPSESAITTATNYACQFAASYTSNKTLIDSIGKIPTSKAAVKSLSVAQKMVVGGACSVATTIAGIFGRKYMKHRAELKEAASNKITMT